MPKTGDGDNLKITIAAIIKINKTNNGLFMNIITYPINIY
jgi:hypothetical protein